MRDTSEPAGNRSPAPSPGMWPGFARHPLWFECSAETAAPALGALTDSGAGCIIADRDASRLTQLHHRLTTRFPKLLMLFFHGDLERLHAILPVSPDTVYLGGEGGPIDPHAVLWLSRLVHPGARLLVKAPAPDTESLLTATGAFDVVEDPTPGWLACAAAGSATGDGAWLSADVFARVAAQLAKKYFALGEMNSSDHTPVAAETRPAREAVAQRFRERLAGWSGRPEAANNFPATLPSGRPWPRISIVTPSLNQGRYIEETILSVLNQGYPNVEHIVIDGGSTDETCEVLVRYRDVLACSVSEPDRGQSHAINKGMALATGEILTWLNSDDMLAPGALFHAALAFDTSGADMVAGICRLYENDRFVGSHLTCCEDGPLPLDDLLDLDGGWNAGQFFYQPEVLFRREIWERAGRSVREDLHYSMDYDLWVRFAEAGARLHSIGHPVAWFRLHEAQKTSAKSEFRSELQQYRDSYLREHRLPVPVSPPPAPPKFSLHWVFVNDRGFEYGAGIAHQRLAQALLLAGHTVDVVALHDERAGLVPERPDWNKVVEFVAAKQPDAILVGNLHRTGTDPILLNMLGAVAPTFVVFHDFWLLTGRCAYFSDCRKYLDGCDESCPTPDEYPALEPARIAAAWERKRSVLRASTAPVLLANSRWTESVIRGALEAAAPPLAEVRLDRVRLGVPADVFRRLDRATARAALGLPHDRFIILLSGDPSDPRKRLRDILVAVEQLDLPRLIVAVAGNVPAGELPDKLDVVSLGYLETPAQLALAYAAADVTAGASREETFGQVFIESAACGTPVLSVSGTGVSEAVVDGVTGILTPECDVDELAARILALYRDAALRRDLGWWGAAYAGNEWPLEMTYAELFRMWRRLGFSDQWSLPHNISFLPDLPPLPEVIHAFNDESGTKLFHGLGVLERPMSDLGLGEFRWAHGPATNIEYVSPDPGPHTLFIKYRNPHPGQSIVIYCNGEKVLESSVPFTGYKEPRLLFADLNLRRGVNDIRLEFSHWNQERRDPRPLAIIIEELALIRD